MKCGFTLNRTLRPVLLFGISGGDAAPGVYVGHVEYDWRKISFFRPDSQKRAPECDKNMTKAPNMPPNNALGRGQTAGRFA